jgi:hypothetical protein
MPTKFEELVRAMEPAALEELRRSVAAELGERRQHTGLQIENIHPRMSEEEKNRALQEIARVLRGDEHV